MNQELMHYWSVNVDKRTERQFQKKSEKELDFLFSKNLEFGTGGARGIMDIGPNAFNIFTVRNLVISYLEFLKTKYPAFVLKQRGIVVYHDNRHMSAEFAQEAAAYLSTNNIKVFIAENNNLKTTPFLSYSIRTLKAVGGINFTASHNPKEYNGFKCYNEHGGQLLPDQCRKIQEFINKVRPEIFYIKPTIFDGLCFEIPEILETGYIELCKIIQHNVLKPRIIKILFSPQSGTTYKIIPRILQESGYHVEVFSSFSHPDPDFTGIKVINPEDHKAFDPLIAYAKDKDFDLLIMADPDGDRFAAAAKIGDNYKVFHGNEIATLMANYHINFVEKRQKLKMKGYTVSTYVSSPILKLISEDYNLEHYSVSTGFKWISDCIAREEQKEHPKMFLFGFEEAIGYLPSNLTLEKDSIQSALLFADMMNYYKNEGKNLEQVLDEIHDDYGHFEYMTFNYLVKNEEIKKEVLQSLLSVSIPKINGTKIVFKDVISSAHEPNPTIMFYFNLEKTSFFAVRASGTENKIKVYCCIHQPKEEAKKLINALHNLFTTELKK